VSEDIRPTIGQAIDIELNRTEESRIVAVHMDWAQVRLWLVVVDLGYTGVRIGQLDLVSEANKVSGWHWTERLPQDSDGWKSWVPEPLWPAIEEHLSK
jgi:hypothetical protein